MNLAMLHHMATQRSNLKGKCVKASAPGPVLSHNGCSWSCPAPLGACSINPAGFSLAPAGAGCIRPCQGAINAAAFITVSVSI